MLALLSWTHAILPLHDLLSTCSSADTESPLTTTTTKIFSTYPLLFTLLNTP
jgi:hypothetical protein